MNRLTYRDLKINKVLLIDSFEELVEFCLINNMNTCGDICDKAFMVYEAKTFIEEDGKAKYKRMLKLFDDFKYCTFDKNGAFVGLADEDLMAYKGLAILELMGIGGLGGSVTILNKVKELLSLNVI